MHLPELRFVPAANYEDAIAQASAESRIDREFYDIFGHRHEASTDVQKGILSALGWDVNSQEAIENERVRRFRSNHLSPLPVTHVVGESDRSVPVTLYSTDGGELSYQLTLEGGETRAATVRFSDVPAARNIRLGDLQWTERTLAIDAPLGYHSLRLLRDGHELATCNFIVCPDRAYVPDRRSAGFNVTLYGLRSGRNWGTGDFTDLRSVIDWANAEAGFSFIGLNPLHALHNRIPYNTSPYLPLSIFYKNVLYVDIEAVPEFAHSRCARQLLDSPKLQQQLQHLRSTDFVAYADIDRLKKRFLKLLYRTFRRASSERKQAFYAYCEREGDLLQNFALYCALDEVLHKQDRNRWTWRQWPEQFQKPNTPEVNRFAQEHGRTIEFYKYIQFVIEEQLSAAQRDAQERGLSIGLYHDLALATDNCGADLWAYRDFYVSGCRVGAPPDDFSPSGQDWAFPPPNSDAHKESGYRLYRESIRKIVSNGGALRIDHVMRLFRLYWIPANVSAAQGTYVRDYASDLMHILALESVRHRNVIVGEDLGTVTDEIRDMLARFGILSYRLFYFEKKRDGSFIHSWDYPQQALVASSTHDLATMTGYWKGRDIEARRQAGLADEADYWSQMDSRKREKQQMIDVLHAEHLLPDGYARNAEHVPEVDGPLHNAIVGFLARVPSTLLLLNQEDLTKETDQQNLPGSTAEYPNWQRKMRAAIEELRSPEWAPYAAMFRDQLRNSGRLV